MGVVYRGIGLVGVKGTDGTTIATIANRLPVSTGLTQPTTPVDTQPVSAASLPLPSGASTSAKQDTAQTTLDSVLAKLSADPATQTTLGAILAKLTADPATQTTLAAILADLQAKADLAETQPVSAASLPLPAGASTAAKQDTGNTSLASVDGKLPATLGQKAMAASMSVTVASDQSAVPVSGPLTDAQLRATAVPVSTHPSAANILNGGLANPSTGTIITVPANKIWKGWLLCTASVVSAIGAAAVNAALTITWNPGAGGTPSWVACAVAISLPTTLATAPAGEGDCNTCVVEVEVYAGTTAGTFSLSNTNCTRWLGACSGSLV